ncbi:MAG: helix-turn-helix domain-containing protein [Streptosporangiales bacterium]|nr:helix-turn-helix domain-containing protein [Streptosporangiales bacterium]
MHQVVLITADSVSPLEAGIAAEVFGVRRPELSWHDYHLALAAPAPGRVATAGGFALAEAHGLQVLRAADTILVAPITDFVDAPAPSPIISELRTAHARGLRIASLCVGAFVLAEAGLLDHQAATTHWRFTDRLARRYPNIHVRPNVLYVDNGQVLTSAGALAALDLCLHLVGRDHGIDAAAQLARRIVVTPRRAGDQAQFVENPIPQAHDHDLAKQLRWAIEHLHEPIGVDALAAHAKLSSRTLARRFAQQLGVSPGQWLRIQRIDRARHLLEVTDQPLDAVAANSGLGSSINLRKIFREQFDMTPAEYRRLHHQIGPAGQQN